MRFFKTKLRPLASTAVFCCMSLVIGCTAEIEAIPAPAPDLLDGAWQIDFVTDDGENGSDTWVIDQSGSRLDVIYGSGVGAVATVEGDHMSMAMASAGVDVQVEGTIGVDVISGSFSGTTETDKEIAGSVTFTRISNSTEIPERALPAHAIVVDGDASDWAAIEPLILDDVNDGGDDPGAELESLKLALSDDGQRMYALVQVSNGPIDVHSEVGFQIRFTGRDWTELTEEMIDLYATDDPRQWYLQQRHETVADGSSGHHELEGDFSVEGNYVEIGFDITNLTGIDDAAEFDALRVDVRVDGDKDRDDGNFFGFVMRP